MAVKEQDGDVRFDGAVEIVGALVVNEAGANIDVRMEGDTNANLFFLDASADGVGFGVAPNSRLGVQAGTSSNDAAVGGTLYVDSTQRANSGTGETDLASYSLPANSLATNNQRITIDAWGTVAANGNSRTVKVYFGTDNWTILSTNSSGISWSVHVDIVRTGAATQKVHIRYLQSNGGGTPVIVSTASATLSGAVTVKLTGQGGATNDILQQGMVVTWHDANT